LRPPTRLQEAPYADLAPFPDYQRYIASLSKNMRKSLRRRQDLLRKADATFSIATGKDAREALDIALRFKRDWMIQHGSLSTAFSDVSSRDCLLDLAESHAQTGAVVMTLAIGGTPAAIRFGFEYRGVYYGYLAAYDPRFAEFGPGKMALDAYLREFPSRKIARVDLLAPVQPHKSDFCHQKIGVADYTLPLTLAGHAYVRAYWESIRPALRRCWLAMPQMVRSIATYILISI
jgi:CelD/BcsL family acetyltransferase involved in cellulose biosynthesis